MLSDASTTDEETIEEVAAREQRVADSVADTAKDASEAGTSSGPRRSGRVINPPVNEYLLACHIDEWQRAVWKKDLEDAKRELAIANAAEDAQERAREARGQGRCQRSYGGKRSLWLRDDADVAPTPAQDLALFHKQDALCKLYRFKNQAAKDLYQPNPEDQSESDHHDTTQESVEEQEDLPEGEDLSVFLDVSDLPLAVAEEGSETDEEVGDLVIDEGSNETMSDEF